MRLPDMYRVLKLHGRPSALRRPSKQRRPDMHRHGRRSIGVRASFAGFGRLLHDCKHWRLRYGRCNYGRFQLRRCGCFFGAERHDSVLKRHTARLLVSVLEQQVVHRRTNVLLGRLTDSRPAKLLANLSKGRSRNDYHRTRAHGEEVRFERVHFARHIRRILRQYTTRVSRPGIGRLQLHRRGILGRPSKGHSLRCPHQRVRLWETHSARTSFLGLD